MSAGSVGKIIPDSVCLICSLALDLEESSMNSSQLINEM